MSVKSLILDAISHEEFVFYEANIYEVIWVASESLHSIKTKQMYVMVVKNDLSKAYDMIGYI